MITPSRYGKALKIAAVVAIVFGALTVFSGGMVLIGGPAARAAVGNAVPFVLWFNFLAGFAYVAVGIGLWRSRRWARWFSAVILIATFMVLVAFGLHVVGGGAYETRTVGAMILRTGVWAAITLIAMRGIAIKD